MKTLTTIIALSSLAAGMIFWQSASAQTGSEPKALPEEVSKAYGAAQKLKHELGGVLKKALEEKGAVGALEFCSLQAMPLTEALSEQTGFTISRITDRPRNPANRANQTDQLMLKEMRQNLANELQSDFYMLEGAVYTPLVTNPMCLVCHGENLAPELSAELAERYPDDKATGYGLDQLRGAIKVVYEQQ